jgi:MFS family permease
LGADFHASGAELQLVVAIYTVAFAALVVIGARWGDNVGHRRAFKQGLAGFTLASAGAGLAPTAPTLIAARGLQGAAAALLTAQVLSIIQVEFGGEMQARAIGAYSAILAVGVAAGQIIGGLLVSAHLTSSAWRPALLVNAPIGAVLLAGSRRALPALGARRGERLDLGGAGLLAFALVALVVPLSFGRDYGWPAWVWPCMGACATAGWAFVARERRLQVRGAQPLFDLRLLQAPRIAWGVLAVLLGMSCYAGFLFSLTLYLQHGRGFSPLHAGLTFAIYASGFATASLTWTHLPAVARKRLPLVGPLLMGAAVLAVGLISYQDGWSLTATTPLLFAGGVGHASGFSPLASRLTTLVEPGWAADLSGLILTADFIGMALGAACFVGVYLTSAQHNAARALAITTGALAVTLLATAASAAAATRPEPRRMIARFQTEHPRQ